jgi:hypothetical protein
VLIIRKISLKTRLTGGKDMSGISRLKKILTWTIMSTAVLALTATPMINATPSSDESSAME